MSTEERIAIKQKLKDDLPHYASRCLRIRTKSGDIAPFVLNKAQLHIHNLLEKQRGETGKVRAIICKGRQQGCCYSPDSRVLTSDYRWIKLEDVQLGDKLMAVDEHPFIQNASKKITERRMRVADVEAKAYLIKEAFEVKLSNGVKLIVTGEHRHLCKQRGGAMTQWRTIDNCKIGDFIRAFSCPPDNHEPDYDDGWFGGLLDGEGSFGAYPAVRIALSQIDGPVLRRAKKYLDDRNIKYYELIDNRVSGISSKLGDKPVHCIRIDRQSDILKVLSSTRPARFINKQLFVNRKLPKSCEGFKSWVKIESIKSIGRQKVIDLQTSEKTFICEGLVSHNSSYVGARFYHKVTHNFGTQAFILTHALDATNNLYAMTKRFYENTPAEVRPQVSKSNAKELVFGLLDSSYKLGTAENKRVGRSSTIQLLHASEAAYWNNAAEHATGIMQAVPNAPGTEIIIESTSNGVGNFYHQEWQKAEAGISDFIPIFIPWYWQNEYWEYPPHDFIATADELELMQLYNLTIGQICWRRKKVIQLSVSGIDGEKSFAVEYPNNPSESFQLTGEDSFVNSSLVVAARHTICDKFGPVLVGVDPARFGDDRTSIVMRQGRVAFNLKSYVKKDTMEVAGIVHQLIKEHSPEWVMIDIGGLGAGVYDRLVELIGLNSKTKLLSVNAGSSPLDAKRYKNKKAEMWGTMKEWLADVPVQIPDSDSLHADLCGVKYKFDSNTRLVMESKEEMKKRGIRSSDEADALCLTFALPDSALLANKSTDDVLNSLTESFDKRMAATNRTRR